MGGLHGMMKYKHDDILDMNVEAFDKLLEVIQNSKGATKEETDAANSLAMAAGGGGSTMGGVFSKMVVDTASLPPPPPEVTAAEDAEADQAAERAETNPIPDTGNEPSSPWTPFGSASGSTTSAAAPLPSSSSSSNGAVSSVLDMFEPVKAPTIQISGGPKFMTSQDKFLLHQAGELSGLATVKPRKIPSLCIKNPAACDLSKFQTSV